MAALILAIVISVIVVAVAVVDFAAFRHKHPRALMLEMAGFFGIIVLAFWSDGVASLARAVGIGRGVDLVIYPLMIWLFREAVLGRVRYHRQQRLITDLTRQLAVVESRVTWPKTDEDASAEPERADAG